jgi:bacitracin synthase 3
MRNITTLIDDLREEGVGLNLKGNDLEISLFKGEINDHLLELIKNNKEEIKEYIKSFSLGEDYAQIPKATQSENYELSSAQLRLWVLSQFEGESASYNMPYQIELDGEYNIESFKRAIEATIDRHEILRTVFKEDELGEIKQWVLATEDLAFSIDYQDYRLGDNTKEQVETYILADSYEPFDLEKGPLLRASLLQIADDRYVFYYNMHHIISDGWSMEVLAKDVLAYYEGYQEVKDPDILPLRIQYKDYTLWQLNHLVETSSKDHKTYWLDQFEVD